MTSRQVKLQGHTGIVKMLQGLEATNQNGKLYMRGILRDPRVQRWPTHRIIKELQGKF
jgi:hypothetical protein